MFSKKLFVLTLLAGVLALSACGGSSSSASSSEGKKATTQPVESVRLDEDGNKVYYFNFKDTVQSGINSGVLDGSVKFYLAGAGGGGSVVHRGLVTIKRTNAFNKSAEQACEIAMQSALIQFQKRAKSSSANKVTNIVSYYKKQTYKNAQKYECHVGKMMAAVTIKADVAR